MERRKGETAEEYLERIPSFAREKSDPGTIRRFLGRLGDPDRDMKIFHVAGTNGKGSVCAFLSSVLKEAAIPFGTFTSPHLVDIRERFSLNGSMISQKQFSDAFEAVYEVVSQWVEEGNLHPTYFEYLFYMGVWLFSKNRVQILVLETGMGGLKDVTNVIEAPLVSVITSISIDHTAFLGSTVSEIAVHKAGIIKPACPVVYDASCAEASAVIEAEAKRKNSPAVAVDRIPFTACGEALCIRVPYLGEQTQFEIPSVAPYQAVNASLAIKALELSGLGIGTGKVREGIRNMRWPARMEKILPGVYLDGAHNEDGIRAFLTAACFLKEQRKPKETRLLFSVASDKDYEVMLKEIGERLCPDICVLTGMENKRVLPMDELYHAAEKAMGENVKIRCFKTVKEAFDTFLENRTDQTLSLIAGSLYLAGEIREWLEDMDPDTAKRRNCCD